MKWVTFACLVLGCCQTAYAQQPLPPVSANPYPACVAAAVPDSGVHRLEHLLKAAEHLKAAGMKVEAGKLRQQVEAERQVVLARIDALQAEVERLRQLVNGPRQVVVQVKMLEVFRRRMRHVTHDYITAGTDPSEPLSVHREPFRFDVIYDDNSVLTIIEALRKNGVLRVLAEPTLVTLSGQPASFLLGGEFPAAVTREDGTVAIELRKFGTRVDLLPVVLDEGRIRLKVHARVSNIDSSRTVEVEGQSCPGLNVRSISTTVELRAGQTLILGGLVQERAAKPVATASEKAFAWLAEQVAEKTGPAADDREETELLLVITPDFVQSSWLPGERPAPPKPASWAFPPAVAAEPKGPYLR